MDARFVRALAGAAVLAGCSFLDSGEHFVISTDQPSYIPGQAVGVTFTNRRDSHVSYNHCPGYLQHEGAQGWATVAYATGYAECPEYIGRLRPGESFRFYYPLPADLEPGVYRYLFDSLYDAYDGEHTLLPEGERLSSHFRVIKTFP